MARLERPAAVVAGFPPSREFDNRGPNHVGSQQLAVVPFVFCDPGSPCSGRPVGNAQERHAILGVRCTDRAMRLSIIVPAYNDADRLVECLTALEQALPEDGEIIVVDDASTDDTVSRLGTRQARVIRRARNAGPAAARNDGARVARGQILLFVDADVVVAADAVSRVLATFAAEPELAAVFGSYDARPRAPGVVSRYRNLLHHFVHQHGNSDASTFWAGLGAIRRTVFEAAGGFDAARFPHASIEDIELGYRLRAAGYRIRLDKHLSGTHLKRWTLATMVWTDITRRATPWSRLILERGMMPKDLNVERGQRASAGLVALGGTSLALATIRPWFLVLAGAAFTGVLVINRRLYALFLREGGPGFLAASVPLHVLYFAYSGASYLLTWAAHRMRQRPSARALAPTHERNAS